MIPGASTASGSGRYEFGRSSVAVMELLVTHGTCDVDAFDPFGSTLPYDWRYTHRRLARIAIDCERYFFWKRVH
jgi:hypothetical protein